MTVVVVVAIPRDGYIVHVVIVVVVAVVGGGNHGAVSVVFWRRTPAHEGQWLWLTVS